MTPPEPVEVIRASSLGGVPHGFLGRRGGVSQGLVAGLNVGLGAGDEPLAVEENRKRAATAVLARARLTTVYQVHSPDCVTVDRPWNDDERPHADALVTDRPGILLGIVTADCAPVLLADVGAGVVGAAHAGWKGAIGGVVERTVEAMAALGARRERIVAAIGPCIAQSSYEVDEAFRRRFLAEAADHGGFFVPGRSGRWQFDLEGFIAHRLRQSGVPTTEKLGLDTCSAPERFFSYRRATLAGEPSYGRQIALVAVPEGL